MNLGEEAFLAYLHICEVLPTKSATSCTSGLHSGCAITLAFGFSCFRRRMSSFKKSRWVGQKPPGGIGIIFLLVFCWTYHARFVSGPKSNVSASMAFVISTALAEVQHTSHSVFASAKVFT